ncbi:hypothetical protein NCER_100277 [Vairimorpha ceranae BRL01]|uniref:Uncharacterized protein n=2 Tax=Vairimorpha ceranae TaxID=40302 RepID=C4V760_VAIC1|nr:hypothetical protein AAJ76_500020864 [Vairimorpha ceranae]EEQ82946.1 hypothetical protein NCER_100277 [Vairimorpha ceranae BRL01]KAF5141479.1 hypothetical protein G9O61_00g003420 [Vairimorpha ceranae]KKO76212.1 hypothetical protein AAJ76_500020864 [Vairimorpha ceranae]
MEFGQIIIAQFTSLVSLFMIFYLLDTPLIRKFSEIVYKNTIINVSDDKGIFLFIFLTYLIVMISTLEVIRNMIGKNYSLRDKILYIQTCNYNNSFLLFANFLSLYIFKKLSVRTFNLLILGIINSLLYNLTYLMGLKSLSGLFYCNFLITNLLNLLSTFIVRFDYLLSSIVAIYKGYKVFN